MDFFFFDWLVGFVCFLFIVAILIHAYGVYTLW